MRTTRPTLALPLLALLSAGGVARAAEAPLPPRPAADAPRFGIALDAGFPSGAAAALTFTPVAPLRLYAGPAWNYVSWGVVGGAVLVPFRLPVAPALSGEVGRYFGADLTHFVNTSSGAFAGTAPLLRDVGVTYAALLLGVELGAQRGLAFSLRAGLAWLWASSSGPTEPTGSGAQVTLRDARFHATAPSVKLGLRYSF
jgi:hypothetical protein